MDGGISRFAQVLVEPGNTEGFRNIAEARQLLLEHDRENAVLIAPVLRLRMGGGWGGAARAVLLTSCQFLCRLL